MKLTATILLITAALASANAVTMEQARSFAEARIPATHAVTNGFPLEGDQHEPPGYVFELFPAGFVITSAHQCLPPVIAYSYTTDLNGPGGKNPMIELATFDLTQRESHIELLPENYAQSCMDAWLSPPGILAEQWPPEGTTPTEGWLEENWTQSAPYNAFCPMDLAAGSRSLAGCPAVAMGSILNFHGETNGTRFTDDDDYYHNYHEYYWIDDDSENHDFPSWAELNILLDTLEAHYTAGTLTNQDRAAVVYASGAACKQVYSASASGTFGVGQAYDAYLRFGFDSCELLGESADSLTERMARNMMDAMPVHLAIIDEGPQYGHNVVVDGYNTDEFFHINFGWGGSNNGWYSFPLTGMPYGMNIIEGVVVDIGIPLQSIEEGCNQGELNILSITNPVNGVLSAEVSGPAEATVYSLSGRLVEATIADPANPLCVSTCDYRKGVYILRITDGSSNDTAVFTVLN